MFGCPYFCYRSSRLCNGVHPNQSCVSAQLNYALTYKITRIYYTWNKYVFIHARTVSVFKWMWDDDQVTPNNRAIETKPNEIVHFFFLFIRFTVASFSFSFTCKPPSVERYLIVLRDDCWAVKDDPGIYIYIPFEIHVNCITSKQVTNKMLDDTIRRMNDWSVWCGSTLNLLCIAYTITSKSNYWNLWCWNGILFSFFFLVVVCRFFSLKRLPK